MKNCKNAKYICQKNNKAASQIFRTRAKPCDGAAEGKSKRPICSKKDFSEDFHRVFKHIEGNNEKVMIFEVNH